MSLSFSADSPHAKTLLEWFEDLRDNRGDRAALRRCHQPLEVLFVPAYHHLYQKLRQHGDLQPGRLPVVAGLLAHVKQHQGRHNLAQQMAIPEQGASKPPVSELRFRRLLQTGSDDELFADLRRMLELLEGTANIFSLANDVYFWGDKVRRSWAYDYFGAPTTQ